MNQDRQWIHSRQRYQYVGANLVWQLLWSDEPCSLERFRTPEMWLNLSIESLSFEPLDRAFRAYVLACESDEARALDEDAKGIGGKIQIANMTPNGVVWRSE